MNRLKYLREETGLTQAQVAREVGTSQRNVGRWEKGESEMGANYAVLLAHFFSVTVEYLLGYEDDFGISTIGEKRGLPLSDAERELLRAYRRMPKERQKIALDTVCALAGKPRE